MLFCSFVRKLQIQKVTILLVVSYFSVVYAEDPGGDYTTDASMFVEAAASSTAQTEHYVQLKNQFINLLMATKINSLSITINPSQEQYKNILFNDDNQDQLDFFTHAFEQAKMSGKADDLDLPIGFVINGLRGNGRKKWISSLASKVGASVVYVNCFGLVHLYSYIAAAYTQQLFELCEVLNQLQGPEGKTFLVLDNFDMIVAKSQPIQNCLTESFDLEMTKLSRNKQIKTYVFGLTEDFRRIDSKLLEANKFCLILNFANPSPLVRKIFLKKMKHLYNCDSSVKVKEWVDICEGLSFKSILTLFESAIWKAKQAGRSAISNAILKEIFTQLFDQAPYVEEEPASASFKPDHPDSDASMNAQVWPTGSVSTRFEDVVVDPRIKEEVLDVLTFVKHPERFEKTKGRIPNGIVLYGPTGTGKTLFARALAGEAGCGFISVNASLLTSKYLGDSAKNIKKLFNMARRMAKAEGKPCIIFCDEVDSFALRRGSSYGTVNDDSRQMLNQFLCELDGFGTEHGKVIVIAATNRFEDLDEAVLRPGRLERHICMELPSLSLRREMFERTRLEFSIDESVDTEELAKITTQFSGADIKNMVNEAAIIAAKEDEPAVLQRHLLLAHDKLILGVENRSKSLTKQAILETAYHEVGHALAAIYYKKATPFKRVTCVPRGLALGVTSCYPDEDVFSKSKENLFAELVMLYGGAVAEEMMTGTLSTGARNDLQRATYIAKKYVCDFGMSELGCFYIPDKVAESKEVVDTIVNLLKKARSECQLLLMEHKTELICFAHKLVEQETMDRAQVLDFLETVKDFEESLKSLAYSE